MKDIFNNSNFDIEFKDIIKRNLIFLRNQNKLTTEQVANVLHVSRQAYSAYENGRRDISITNLKILAVFYGLSLDLITSSELQNINENVVKFPTIILHNSEYEFCSFMSDVKNINSSIIEVKQNEKKIIFFETNTSYVKDHELLFEFKKKIHIGKIHFFSDGGGCFIEDNNVYNFSKKESSQLVIMGMLMATLNKEYDKRNFF